MMRNLSLNKSVTPAQAGVGLFFCDLASVASAAKGSQAPDQVRGDDDGEGSVLK
jgi:hypothetical protein